ncbi:MAG: bifunctional DNA primase/polymerase, partial [Nitrospinae bacterium]|nr:bifunctional DNA primase/polymerase [Nitrospinota bacterium]
MTSRFEVVAMVRNFMHEYGDRLLANGYPILPIMPGEKKPGRFQRGQWVDYPGWTKHGERGTTDIELAAWKGWPDAGIGIAGGFIVGVDIDVAD